MGKSHRGETRKKPFAKNAGNNKLSGDGKDLTKADWGGAPNLKSVTGKKKLG